jgi:hypothetical protein
VLLKSGATAHKANGRINGDARQSPTHVRIDMEKLIVLPCGGAFVLALALYGVHAIVTKRAGRTRQQRVEGKAAVTIGWVRVACAPFCLVVLLVYGLLG